MNEQTDGTVSAFDVVGDALVHRATVPSGGADPCHLLLDADGRTLFVANYTSGTLGVLPLDADGGFSAHGPDQVLGHAGSGPDEDRQESPHAHFVALDPSGAFVLVVDLGTDEIRRYRREDGRLVEDGIAAALPAGTGPAAPDVQRGRPVRVRGRRAGRHGPGAGVGGGRRDARADPAGDDGARRRSAGCRRTSSATATGCWSACGRRTCSRGSRSAPTGCSTPVADDALPGAWPRHLEVVDGWTVVAEQVSDGSGRRSHADGSVRGDDLPLPAPSCVSVPGTLRKPVIES